jgi:hypothetical protein
MYFINYPIIDFMTNWLIILPFLSAIIGWILCKIGIWFLLYRTWPSKQTRLAAAISSFAVAEFASLDLEKKIGDPSNLKKAQPLVEQHVDNFLRVKLKDEMPMISMFIGDKTIETLKSIFMRELENLFPEVMKSFAGNMKSELNIESIVNQKIAAISSSQLKKIAGKELLKIQLFAALAGLIIGLINFLIIILV